MKQLFDDLSMSFSRLTTLKYSTSFSLGIKFLNKDIRQPIYNIYGFVRFADEIVDSFNAYDQVLLMKQFESDLHDALENRISLNPILNAFQQTVHKYHIKREYIDQFILSMKVDLSKKCHDKESYDNYIYGSAEAVGLMCLQVFVNKDQELYNELKPYAQHLGAAFQKVNFLRDIKSDYERLGRIYFPNMEITQFSSEQKRKIEEEIEEDFTFALEGIKKLPSNSRGGVYLAYFYYQRLFRKIKNTPAQQILYKRIRIPNVKKFGLLIQSFLRHEMNIL